MSGGAFGLRFGGSGADSATAVETDATTGASYVAGRFESGITAGSFTETSAGSGDGFVVRVDSTGTVTWLKKCVYVIRIPLFWMTVGVLHFAM
jgi:hypothetical protein